MRIFMKSGMIGLVKSVWRSYETRYEGFFSVIGL